MVGGPPDILLVVLDCVRADSFPGLDGGRIAAPFLRSLLPRSTLWTHAVSVAPWTRPAHASLFTGLYPWEHGCHTKGRATLAPESGRLATELGRTGYQTLCLSANPQISPETGLAGGFERAAWAEWGERARLRRTMTTPAHEAERIPLLTASVPVPAGRSRLNYLRAVAQHRYLWASDVARRTALSIRGELRDPRADRLAPWVEATLDRYLKACAADRPVFAFVNLLDAHEPYFPSTAHDRATRWWTVAGLPQDHFGFLSGRNPLDPYALKVLRREYERQIGVLDARVQELVETWSRRRGEGTLSLIVTSDHGQAFGEHGAVFHSLSPDEPHLRIPLLMSRPGEPPGPPLRDERVSLLDVHATVRAMAGLPGSPSANGRPLLDERIPERVVLAASDGLPSGFPFDSFVSAAQRAALDRVWGVAYEGRWKVWVDAATGRERVFDLLEDPTEDRDRGPEEQGPSERTRGLARAVARGMVQPPSDGGQVLGRLAAWGYYQ